MLQRIAKLLKVLNSEANPAQISLALVLGLIAGLTPVLSLHNVLVLLLACVLRVNFSAFILSTVVFSGIAYLLDPVFVALGEYLLTEQSLQSFWTTLYQVDFWRLLHFNHTVTLGSVLVSLGLSLPAFFLSRFIIIKYRVHIMTWVQKTRLARWLRASKLYDVYSSLELGG